MMAMQPRVSADFLADLNLVCPKTDNVNLPLTFLNDMETAYVHAQTVSLQQPAISAAELTSLAEHLKTWRSHHQRLLQLYLAQLPSDDPLLSPVSLFGTMDYGRLETAHTRALAWLLGDREHGFRFQLLEALLRHLLERRRIRLTHVDKVESEYLVYCGPAPTDSGRIDILAEGRWEELGNEVFWRLVIEAKIDAEESEEQLSQYDDWLEQYSQPTEEVLRVFLTPNGREPWTSSGKWQALSFVDLASVFRRISGLQDRPGYHFLRYYLTGVLRDVCRLPVPITSDCENPYAAVDYLQSVLGIDLSEVGHGHSR
jgi:hypothetical protein